jgi:chromosome segregation ATPase
MEPSAVSHRPLIGSLVVLIKRIVRKSIRWYVAPQLEDMRAKLAAYEQRASTTPDALRAELLRLEHQLRIDQASLAAQVRSFHQILDSKIGSLSAEQKEAWSSWEGQEEDCKSRFADWQHDLAQVHHRLADLDTRRLSLHASVQAQLVSLDQRYAEKLAELTARLQECTERLPALESRLAQVP